MLKCSHMGPVLLCSARRRGRERGPHVSHLLATAIALGPEENVGPLAALDMGPQPWRKAPPMRPTPSLAYVSTLLDPRRRRHHRVRRLWYAGLGLLGLGLLLGGWWVTRRLVPRSAPTAAVSLVLWPT